MVTKLLLSWLGTITSQRCLIHVINIDIDAFPLIFASASWMICNSKTISYAKIFKKPEGKLGHSPIPNCLELICHPSKSYFQALIFR